MIAKRGAFALGWTLVVGLSACGEQRDHPAFLCENCAGGGSGNAGRGGGSSAGSAGATVTAWFTDYDCSDTKPCAAGECIEITPGGFKTCSLPAQPAQDCSGNPEDECCTSADCGSGICVASDTFGDPPPNVNQCVTPCVSDSDCSYEGDICLPQGVLGRPIGGCMQAMCRTNADCTEHSGGICAPVEDKCLRTYQSLTCIYPEGACRRNSDCSDAEPPFGPGDRFCEFGYCTAVLAGTITCE